MKSFRFRLFVAALAVLMGSAIAKSQTADAPPVRAVDAPGFGMRGHMQFLSKKLNLSDEQKSQMKAIMQKERPALRPLLEQQHQLDLQLRQYAEGSFDEAQVRALATKKAQIQAQLTVEETRVHNQMYQMLTSDQQSQLKQMEADREAHIEQHMNQAPPAPAEQ
jgi:Spy/CpxP family protein refolding chaperone